MELLVDLKDEDPSPLLPENTESRKLVFRKEGLIPPFRGASGNLSKTKSLHSLQGQLSIPLPEKVGRGPKHSSFVSSSYLVSSS